MLVPRGKILIHDGKILQEEPPPRTVNFCPLCNGASFLFSVETSGITVGVVNSCEILQAGFNSEMFKVLPYVLPNCTTILLLESYTQRAGYPSGIKIVQDGLAQGSFAWDTDDALFQSPTWMDGDWVDGPRCYWLGGSWWDSGKNPAYGQYYQYIEEDDCSGFYYDWRFQAITFELKVWNEHATLYGFYDIERSDTGTDTYVFFYATIDRTPGDTGPFEFTNEKEGGVMYGGTATVTLIGDPVIQDGLAQKSLTDDPIFQGDVF